MTVAGAGLPVRPSCAAAQLHQPQIAVPTTLQSAAAASADLVPSTTTAAAAHASKLLDTAREQETSTQSELSTWKAAMEGVTAVGPLSEGQQQFFQDGLDAREKAHMKAQVTVTVHQEWSRFWSTF